MKEAGISLIPQLPIQWREPWYPINDQAHQQGIQEELQREIGPLHPLWNTNPVVFAKRCDCDDVGVYLADGRFAIVHLVWHGHIDQFPDRYPATRLFDSLAAFQQAVDSDVIDWGSDE